jgi:hypothetical protein
MTDVTDDRRRRTATLTLPIGPDRERAVRAARLWFRVCPEALHGPFGAAVRAGDTGATGRVVASVDVAIWDGVHPEPGEWFEPYSAASFEELLQRLGPLPDSAGFQAWTPNERGMRTAGPGFEVAVSAQDTYVDLFSTIDDTVEDGAILAAVREVAERGAPLAVALAFQGSSRETPLEEAISRTNTKYVRRPAEVLRNYGWLTILSDAMADRVGGADRLRGSGAFVEVSPLAAGGWWLLATETWDEYGPEQAERLFELLAPVLPDGKAQMTHWVPGGPDYTSPNVLAERDPREA